MTTIIAERESTLPPPSFWQGTPDTAQTEPPIAEDRTGAEIGEKRDRPGFQSQSNGVGVEIIGRSPALRAVLKDVQIVARTNATVLILGETGTGKELIARALHSQSPRRLHALSKINCAAIPAGLLESELFGHERGAFTGAVGRKTGRVELAHQGTLFLDEIGDIPLELQPKLLRLLQEKEFERLGGTHTHQIDARVVAATSRNLVQLVADRQFRSDLYYRLNVFPIRMPALRERLADIPLLVQHFVSKCARQMNKQIETIPPHILDHLSNYHWPGNIRELQNVIERAVILSSGKNLQFPLVQLEQSGHVAPASNGASPSGPATLEDCEREHILRTLNENRWVVGGPNGAAALLGLKRTTLISKMQKLGIARKAKPNCQINQRNLL